MSYLWVIGGGQLQIPLIEEANALGLKTIVSDLNPHCVARPYADIFVEMDIFDVQAHVAYLSAHGGLEIAGVLAAGIDAPETMAAMNRFLGLKGVSSEIADVTKNKHRFRQRLRELGYPVPEFVVVTRERPEDQAAALRAMPFPVIVKPVNNSGSRDMKIFERFDAELMHFIAADLEKYPLLLVEELWRGSEQTVECLVDIDGRFHRGFITDRHFTFEGGFPVEMGLVHPTELDGALQEELYRLAEQLAADLGIEVGAVKLDTIVTDAGPRVIEMTVRHSGGFDCQYLVPRSTGKNILKAAIMTAIQKPFDPALLQARFKRFGRTGSLWPKPGRIRAVSGVEEARKVPGVEAVFMRYDVGDRVEPYTDCAKRVAFVIATGETREAADAAVEKALSVIEVATE